MATPFGWVIAGSEFLIVSPLKLKEGFDQRAKFARRVTCFLQRWPACSAAETADR